MGIDITYFNNASIKCIIIKKVKDKLTLMTSHWSSDCLIRSDFNGCLSKVGCTKAKALPIGWNDMKNTY